MYLRIRLPGFKRRIRLSDFKRSHELLTYTFFPGLFFGEKCKQNFRLKCGIFGNSKNTSQGKHNLSLLFHHWERKFRSSLQPLGKKSLSNLIKIFISIVLSVLYVQDIKVFLCLLFCSGSWVYLHV